MSIPDAYRGKLESWGFVPENIPDSVHAFIGSILSASFPEEIAKKGLADMINYAQTVEDLTKARRNDSAVRTFVLALVREFPKEMENIGVDGVMKMVRK